MTTPDALRHSFSFIGVLESDEVLAPYGHNALPLFAIGLHLQVEDLAAFATECLTDSPNDKKADIIYINEADGIACIAQGTTATEWGKAEAPANKASDLNTAAAWLLSQPIPDIPENIRGPGQIVARRPRTKNDHNTRFRIRTQCLRISKCSGRIASNQTIGKRSRYIP